MFLNFKRIKIRISFFFLAFAALCCSLSRINCVSAALVLIFWHELGHIAMIMLTGQRIKAIAVRLGGFEIDCTMPKTALKRFLIYSGGLLFNLLAAGALKIAEAGQTLQITNMLLLIINALPASPLDGGRLFELAMFNMVNAVRADRICITVSYITSAVVVVIGVTVFAISGFPSMAIFGAYLIFTVFQQYYDF